MSNYTTLVNGHSNFDGTSLILESYVLDCDKAQIPRHQDDVTNVKPLFSRFKTLSRKAKKSLWAIVFFHKKGKLLRPIELQVATGLSEYYGRSTVEQLAEQDFIAVEDIPLNQREGNAKTWYRLIETDLKSLEDLLMSDLSLEEQELNSLGSSLPNCRESGSKKMMTQRSIDDLLSAMRPQHRDSYRRMAEFLASNGPSTAKEATEALDLPRVETGRDQLHKLVQLHAAKRTPKKGSKEIIFSLLPNVCIGESTSTTNEVSEEMSRNGLEEKNGSEMGLITERLLKLYPAFDPTWDKDLKKAWFETFNQLLQIEQGGRTQ